MPFTREVKAMKYKLVNNSEFGFKGVYYGGLNEKYHDMFNIITRDCAKVFETREDAQKCKEMLKRRFRYEHFEIEEVCEGEKDE